MSTRGKLAIAFAGSLALIAGAFTIIDKGPALPEGPVAGREEPPPPAAPASPPPAVPAEPSREVPAAPAPGWTIAGRIVRIVPGGGIEPAGGAAVALAGHPRQTKPEDRPPPERRVAGADGRFEFAGVTGRIRMRLTIDEPASAAIAVSCQLGDPAGDARRDLGDIVLEAGHDVEVRLEGPDGEPVEGGSVLAGRVVPGPDRLVELGFSSSRLDAAPRGGNLLALERIAAGKWSLEASAPGRIPGRAEIEVPSGEPVVIRLEKGLSVAGVVRTRDGAPIPGATVSGGNSKATSDADGRFLVDGLPPGRMVLQATADGFLDLWKEVAAGEAQAEFILAPAADFSGTVIADEDGAPVAGAQVTLVSSSFGGRSSHGAETDRTGAFSFRKAAPGRHEVRILHRDFALLEEKSLELREGEKMEGRTFRLIRGLEATGTVTEAATGAPVAGARVSFEIRRSSGEVPESRQAESGADGSYTVKGLREERYSVSAEAKGFIPAKPLRVPIAAEGPRVFPIALERGGSIAGRVLGDGDAPLPGAMVSVIVPLAVGDDESGSSFTSRSARTDEEGRYLLEELPAGGSYTLQCRHEEYAPGRLTGIGVAIGERTEAADIRLGKGCSIRGRVLDEGGAGIAGADVSASIDPRTVALGGDPDSFRFRSGSGARTDDSGAFSIGRLAPGTYRVRAQAKDRIPATREGVATAEGRPAEGIDLVLETGDSLRGRVVDGEGRPVAGASVQVSGEIAESSATCDAEGRFEAKNLKAGRATVFAHQEGYSGKPVETAVPGGDEVTVVLERMAVIIGAVRAPGREVFDGFEITAFRQTEGGSMGTSGAGEASGRFEIQVEEGTHVLTAHVRGFAPSSSAPIAVGKGERKEGVVIDLVEGGTVRGVVVERATGEPVEGVQLMCRSENPRSAGRMDFMEMRGGNNRTDSDGAFAIEDLAEATVTITATHSRYPAAKVEGVAVRAGKAVDLRIELSDGGSIRGLVTRGGAPAAGARISCSSVAGGGGKSARTDDEGRFEIRGLAAGEHRLQVSFSRGMGMRTQRRVTVADGAVTEVVIAEEAPVTVRGRVTAAGEPLRGGMIQARRAEGGEIGPMGGQIDGDGNYTLEVPGAGSYTVIIRGGVSDRGLQARLSLAVAEGSAEVERDFEVPSGGISGTVVEAGTGAAVPQATVMVLPGSSSVRSPFQRSREALSSARSDGDGRFVLGGLEDGAYRLVVTARGHAGTSVEVRVDGRRRGADLVVSLEQGLRFEARVTDEAGGPVQAMGFLRDRSGNLAGAGQTLGRSDDDGLLAIDGVAAGGYELVVTDGSHAPARAPVNVGPGAAAPTIVLGPGGRARVTVTSRGGQPIAGASVELIGDGGNAVDDLLGSPSGSLTDGDGKIDIGPFAPGEYRAAAVKDGKRSAAVRIVIEAGGTAEAALRMPD